MGGRLKEMAGKKMPSPLDLPVCPSPPSCAACARRWFRRRGNVVWQRLCGVFGEGWCGRAVDETSGLTWIDDAWVQRGRG